MNCINLVGFVLREEYLANFLGREAFWLVLRSWSRVEAFHIYKPFYVTLQVVVFP